MKNVTAFIKKYLKELIVALVMTVVTFGFVWLYRYYKNR